MVTIEKHKMTATICGLIGSLVIAASFLVSGVFTSLHARQIPQIPTLQVCNLTLVKGEAKVVIASRSDRDHEGTFTVDIYLKCDPSDSGYPEGTLEIRDLSMSDSIVQGVISAVSFEQVTSTGKHSPTVYLNGRCKAENLSGCRFWLMIADNKRADQDGTADVIGFLVFDGAGRRVAYGTGTVVGGDITVAPT